jgi:hypothetical protein
MTGSGRKPIKLAGIEPWAFHGPFGMLESIQLFK